MTELTEVFVREGQLDQTKQSANDFKQDESITHILIPTSSRDLKSRGSLPEGDSKLIFIECGSSDDFKHFGVREFQYSDDKPTPKEPEDFSLMRNMFKSPEQVSSPAKDKPQVAFPNTELNRQIKYISEVSLLAPIHIRDLSNISPRLSFVKEKPSCDNATLLPLSQNIIRLSINQQVQVSCAEEEVSSWEVGKNFNFMQILKPVGNSVINVHQQTTQTEPIIETKKPQEHNSSMLSSSKNEDLCCEFLSPVAAADLFITDTLENAKEAYYHIISMYGDPDRWSTQSSRKAYKLSSCWPKIKYFTKESGLYSIENYIVTSSKFTEDWKYTILFQDMKEDNVSNHYYYEVIFGLPNKLYPIPQVTASLYFNVEVSRIIPPQCRVKVLFNTEISGYQIDPGNYILKDNVLLRILDMKLLYFKSIYF